MDDLHATALYDLHVSLGAKMVPFAGYSMPVQYPLGVMKEHLHCRAAAGLFDVSHMGQVILSGESWETVALAFETLVPMDVLGLEDGRQRYGFFTNEAGGIEDVGIIGFPQLLCLVVEIQFAARHGFMAQIAALEPRGDLGRHNHPVHIAKASGEEARD